MTLLKRYDVTVLVACDRDYLPLVRKLNALGTAVMVLGWDFTHTDEMGVERQTVTSIDLLAEAAYPLAMQEIVEAADPEDTLVNDLFVEDSGRGHVVGKVSPLGGRRTLGGPRRGPSPGPEQRPGAPRHRPDAEGRLRIHQHGRLVQEPVLFVGGPVGSVIRWATGGATGWAISWARISRASAPPVCIRCKGRPLWKPLQGARRPNFRSNSP